MPSVQAVTFGAGLPGWEVGAKTLPAVIVLQEWWGVTETIKKQAALIAEKGGFRCLVPDLYKGKLGVTAEEAHHLMDNLNFKDAVGELGQAVAYLKETGSPKVGITGFCMGGALTFAAAQHLSELSCAAPCYGIPPAEYFQIEQIKIPLLGIFGGKDAHTGFSDPDSANAAAKKISSAGGNIDMVIYPSAPHAFLNQLIPEAIAETQERQGCLATDEDLQAAFAHLLTFLKKHLH